MRFCLLVFLLPTLASAQTADSLGSMVQERFECKATCPVVTGVVIAAAPDSDTLAANVVLRQSREVVWGTTAEVGGRFSLEVYPGLYALRASFIGLKTYSDSLTVGKDDSLSVTIVLPMGRVLICDQP